MVLFPLSTQSFDLLAIPFLSHELIRLYVGGDGKASQLK